MNLRIKSEPVTVGAFAAACSCILKVWFLCQIYVNTELGTRQFFSLLTTTTQQRNRASGPRKNYKNIKVSVRKWSSQNEFSKNAKSINFEAKKHGHVVATLLSRAQLCVNINERQTYTGAFVTGLVFMRRIRVE